MKYIDAKKLIAEITRIYNEHPVHSTERYEDGIDDGYHGCCDEIVALIESLQQEHKDIIVLNKKDWEKQEQFRKDKKFGIPLQQEQPSLPSNLDEAAKEYDEVESWSYEALPHPRRTAFKAGAEWMARQMKQEQPEVDLEKEIDRVFFQKDYGSDRLYHKEITNIARHFYELGKLCLK